MRCRKCGERAAINLRQHRLALCAEHYLAWFEEQTARTIHKYRMFEPDARILVAVSGGKDSLALWEVLLRLGYHADGLYIDLGIDKGLHYSTHSGEKAADFAAQHPTAHLHIINIAETYGESIPQLARRKRQHQRPCALCGLIKRHEMNRIALESGYDVLATGHNLDDEAATLFGNTLHWQASYLKRQAPVLPADGEGLARKVKPFCRFYERDTAAYTLLRGITYIYNECPYAIGATSIQHKLTLTQLESRAPGTKLQFYVSFLKAKEEGLFCREEMPPADLHPCKECGQPTLAPERCAFCRLWYAEDQVEAENLQSTS